MIIGDYPTTLSYPAMYLRYSSKAGDYPYMIVGDYPTTQPYPDVYLDSRVYLEKQTIHQSADLE